MWIGNVEVTGTARLAPMAAVSNAPFRLIARECGSGLTTTEEIDAISLIRESPVAFDIVRHYPAERPLAMQLLGSDTGLLVRAAEIVEAAGADIVDLNMGCPMPKITKQGKGAALMRDVSTTALTIRALRRAISVPLTVKIRGGWDDEHLNAVEVARMCEDEGVDAITVHPRTRSQRFTGLAPWEIIGEVVKAVRVPVTGNGDVTTMAEARAMVAETGCANVMVGRGSFGRPWVFDEAFEALDEAGQREYRHRVIRRHLGLIADHFAETPRYRMNQVRKHLAWYIEAGVPGSNAARSAVHNAKVEEEAMEAFWGYEEARAVSCEL
jgi:tRNA-dihydrouridine synthase B